MRSPPQWREDRNAGMDAANKSGSGAGSDHGLWKGRVLKRVDVFELRFAQIQCDTLPPLRSRRASGERTLPTNFDAHTIASIYRDARARPSNPTAFCLLLPGPVASF